MSSLTETATTPTTTTTKAAAKPEQNLYGAFVPNAEYF